MDLTHDKELNLPRIVFFCGRKCSGKTTLSDELVKIGYKKFSFAGWLKNICSIISKIDLELFYDPIKKEQLFDIPLRWDIELAEKLKSITDIDVWKIFPFEKDLTSIRDLLQFIGTDILRKHDNNIHINKTIELLNSETFYVCDDLRFKNEKEALEQIGGVGFFIYRPYNFDYSNHPSEVSISLFDTEFQIANLKNADYLKKYFMTGFLNVFKTDKPLNRPDLLMLFKKYGSTEEIGRNLKCSSDKIVWWSSRNLIQLNHNKYTYDTSAFLYPTKEASYFAGLIASDGCIKPSGDSTAFCLEFGSKDRELVDGLKSFLKTDKGIYVKEREKYGNFYYLTLNCPEIIENLKFWNIRPRKNLVKNLIPDIILDDRSLINQWLVGLIDGDGSIYYHGTNKSPVINIIASTSVVDYVANFYKIKSSIERSIKGVANLDSMKFHGSSAIELYRAIYDGIGLERKWSRIKNFA
jgi:hypothetical protein